LDRILGSSMGEATRPKSSLVIRSAIIQEDYLETIDEQLSTHMRKVGVEPQVYLLRWIRCMLSREYRMSDSIIVWDSIFAFFYQNKTEHKTLEMIDYLCLGMLQFVRHDLLMKDDSSMCYARLMKFPPVENIASIISLGLKCKASLNNQNHDLTNFQKQDFLDRSVQISEEKNDKLDSNGKPKKEGNVILFAPGFLKNTKSEPLSDESPELPVRNHAQTSVNSTQKSSTQSATVKDSRPIFFSNVQTSNISQSTAPKATNGQETDKASHVDEKNWNVYHKISSILDLLQKEYDAKPSENLDAALKELVGVNRVFFEANLSGKKELIKINSSLRENSTNSSDGGSLSPLKSNTGNDSKRPALFTQQPSESFDPLGQPIVIKNK